MRLDPVVPPQLPHHVPRRTRPGMAVVAAGDVEAADAEARRQADVEVAVRLYADGTRISVVRRTVADPAAPGGRRTVGIDAVIR